MPASAVAKRTPPIAGTSGRTGGANGDGFAILPKSSSRLAQSVETTKQNEGALIKSLRAAGGAIVRPGAPPSARPARLVAQIERHRSVALHRGPYLEGLPAPSGGPR